jgi:hypothetical protein
MTETTAGVGVQDEPPSWLTKPTPLTPQESAHWQDFRADQCSPRGACRACLFGIPYRGFYRGLVWILLCGSDAASPFLFPQHPKPPRIPNLEKSTELFDRLATHYADAYRGSAVFNYLFGVVAVFSALATLFANPPWVVVPAVIEVVALLVIAATYFSGRARSEHNESPGGPRLFSQRWHERWLDYRGLAERFRYAELRAFLQDSSIPPGVSAAEALVGPGMKDARLREPGVGDLPDRYLRHVMAAGKTDDGAMEDWCTRYFRFELTRTEWPPKRDPIYYANFLCAALDEQQRYHHANAHETKTLTQELHVATAAVFWVSVFAACAELGFQMGGTWIFLTAWLPAFAASLHGIHGACEWKKMARSSRDMEHALTEMRLVVEELLTTGLDSTESVESLGRLVTRFIHVTTDEASGWRAALWDKNVPLGG